MLSFFLSNILKYAKIHISFICLERVNQMETFFLLAGGLLVIIAVVVVVASVSSVVGAVAAEEADVED